jgi:hypothetical protein
VLLEVALDDRRKRAISVEHRSRLFVRDDVEAGEEADAADVADERMAGERAERALHMRADASDVADEVHLLINALHFEGDGRRDRGAPNRCSRRRNCRVCDSRRASPGGSFSLTNSAESGCIAADKALAQVIMSGSRSKVCDPHILPVRPNRRSLRQR